MRREVLQECRRIRPNEFRHVSESQVERVMNILYRNISHVILTNGLLIIKDYLIFRPNVSKMIKRKVNEDRNRTFKEAKRLRYLAGERAAHRLYEKAGTNPADWGKSTDSNQISPP